MALRLTDLLGAVGAFSGRVPPSPPPGRFRRPEVPDDVAAALATLPPRARERVLDPLGRDGAAPAVGRPRPVRLPALAGPGPVARQVDESTCGSTVLAMLLLAGDPRAALRLARRPAGPAAGFATLQRELRARTNRGPLGLPAWPDRYGTPPWGAATVARYGPVRYAHRVVGGLGAGGGVVAAAVEAARAGAPVPLFSGGDLGRGLATAVPRHVVLLTAADEVTARLYEPSSGSLHAVAVAALLRPDEAGPADRAALTAALGGWPHVVWALLPRDARG
jgi:hypothetical protein